MCDGTTAQPGSCTVLVVWCLAHGGDKRTRSFTDKNYKHYTVASSAMIILKVMPQNCVYYYIIPIPLIQQ